MSQTNLTWSGAFNGNWDTVTPNWLANGSPVAFQQGDNVTFNDTSVGSTSINILAAMDPGSVTVNNSALTYTLGGSGTINGTNGLLKEGSGTLYIDANIDNMGTTLVSNGTLAGSGYVNGSVVVEPAGNIGAGDAGAIGVFEVNGNLALQGNTTLRISATGGSLAEDEILIGGNTGYGGTLTIVNATSDGTPFVAGEEFDLFIAGGSSSGAFSNIAGSPGPGLAYSFDPTNGTLSVVSAGGGGSSNISYAVNISAGLNLIANQLDQGGNTLNAIMPNVPDGSALYKYNNGSGTWSTEIYSAANGSWVPGLVTLSPGEGAYFQSPTNFTLQFSGFAHVPILPPTNAPPAGACYLLSDQTNAVADYTNILGTSPSSGARWYQWVSASGSYQVYSYAAHGWVPSEPTAPVGQSVWIAPSGGGTPAPLPTNSFLVYQGLLNESLGNAAFSLNAQSNQLTVANLGASGQDGVSIALPGSLAGLDVQLQNVDPSNALPIGAYVQGTMIGTGGTVTNGLLGTLSMTKTDESGDYQMGVDFEPMGATNCTVLAYLNGQLVGQEVNVPDSLFLKILGHLLVSLGTGLLQNSFWAGVEADFGSSVVCQMNGANVTCDTLFIYPGNVSISGTPSALQITASQVPSFNINTENADFVYQGLTNRSTGHASVQVSSKQFTLNGLGTNSQDGVSIALPSSLGGLDLQFQNPDPSNALPVGAYIQSQMIGTGNGITNGVLGTLTVTKECAVCNGSNYLVSADFSPLGATTCTVQAYDDGVLVAQATNQPAGGIIWLPPIGPFLFDIQTFDFINRLSVDFLFPFPIWMGGIQVTCDHIEITPENVTVPSTTTAFQIVGSHVPSLTVNSENASLEYQGFENSALGNATLEASSTELVISNLGSSGQDGVSIALPGNLNGLDVQLQDADPGNLLPVGAYIEGTAIGTGGTVTNGLLGTLTMTKTDESGDYQMGVDFEPMGATNCTVLAYLNGQLVGQEVNVPDSLFLKLLGHLLVSIGTGLLQNSVTAGIEADFGSSVVCQMNGTNVTCDTLFIYPGNVSISGTPSALQITASQLPSFNINTENADFVYQGLTNRSTGHATVQISGNQFTLSGIGTNGQDGVSIGLPSSLPGLDVQFQNADPSNTLPVGAYVQGSIIGTGGTVTNDVLGTLTMTKTDTSGDYQMAVNFEPMGATNYTVLAYLDGQLVGGETNVPEAEPFSLPNIMNSIGVFIQTLNPIDGILADFEDPVQFAFPNGSQVTCDTLVMYPGNVSITGSPTSLQITASQVPSLTIKNENPISPEVTDFVYQGLTNRSTGHATAQISNGQFTLTGLGTSGQDGVSIALPANLAGLDLQFQNIDPSNSLPVGAYIEGSLIGTGGTVSNGLLGTVTMTKTDDSGDYQMAADFEPMGATNCTVLAYLDGQFVGEETNVPDALVRKITGNLLSTVGFMLVNGNYAMVLDYVQPVSYQMGNGSVVTCNALFVYPGNVSIADVLALEITASQVPSLTIDTENASYEYQGFANTALGYAALAASSSELVISNLGSSGQDGVSIALPSNLNGLDVQLQDADPSNSLPIGAYVQGTIIGTGGTVTNDVLGTLTMTKTDESGDYQMGVDFEPMGATNCTVLAYLNGQLVGQEVNVPDSLFLKLLGHLLVSIGTGLLQNSVTAGIEADFGSSVVCQMNGANVTCDTLFIYPGNVSISGTPSALQITASQVPSFNINTENADFVYQGLTNRSTGHASVQLSGSQFALSGIGTNGQDGVSIGLPSNLAGLDVQLQDPDPSNSLPIGAYIEGTVIGTGGTVTNDVLGTLTMTKTDDSGDYQLGVDFEPMGATNCTVLAYLNGQLVSEEVNVPDSLFLKLLGHLLVSIGTGLLQNSVTAGIEADFGSSVVCQMNGANVTCDTLFIYPGNVSISGTPSTLQITASQVPSLGINTENVDFVYQGLTNRSTGHASVQLSSNQFTLTGLGTSGQDGLSIALPNSLPGLDVQFQDADPSNSLPVGAYIEGTAIGTGGTVTNDVLGTLTMTKTDDSGDYQMGVDFEPMGATNCTVLAYLNGQLVGQEVNVPDSLFLKILGHLLVSLGTGLLQNSVTAGIEADFGSSVVCQMNGANVTCDTLFIYPGNVSIAGTPTTLQITASQVPTLTINNENPISPEVTDFVYQGLTNRSTGHATAQISNGQFTVTGLGTSGQDGVSIGLPAGLAGLDVQLQNADPSNSLPIGAYIEGTAIGTGGTVSNGVLGTLTMTKTDDSGDYQVGVNFEPMGATNCTVLAYLNGQLVGQEVNVPDSLFLKILGHLLVSLGTGILQNSFWAGVQADFGTAVVCQMNGTNVTCDTLFIYPGNVSIADITDLEITASQVPSLTINTENASYEYQGFANTALGYAALAASSSELVISNLGSSGQDGVSIALPSSLAGLDVQLQDADPSNSLPVGAYVQGTIIGTGGTVSNDVLGTLTMTKTDESGDYQMGVNFEPMGATNCTVLAYLNGQLVGQEVNVPDSLFLKILGHLLVSIGTGLLQNSVTAGIEADFGSSVVCQMNGANVTCDTLFIYPGNVSISGTPSALQITASQVPSFNINTENADFVYQGLTNRSTGHATVQISGSQFALSGIGTNGQDGVSIALPSNLAGLDVQLQDPDPSNSLPVGAYIEGTVLGAGGTVTNDVLGTLTMTKTDESGDLQMEVNFEPMGATNCTVLAYLNGQLVSEEVNVPDGLFRKIIGHLLISIGTGLLQNSVIAGVEADFGSTVAYQRGDGTVVSCDTLFIYPGNVSIAGTPSALQITASQVPSFNINTENADFVYQGLTNRSTGHASVQISSNQFTLSGIGTNGQDGVSIALPSSLTGLDVQLQDADPSNSLPVGAYIEGTLIGSGGTVSNGLLGTLTMTKTDESGDYQMGVNFEPMGATTCTVLAYLNGKLVGQESNVPDSLILNIIGRLLRSIGTGLAEDNFGAGIKADFSSAVVCQIGTANVSCDTLFIYPDNVSIPGMPTALQITSSQVPSLGINTENTDFVYHGLTNTSLGHATVQISGSQLTVGQLGSSGQDGVSIALPANLSGLDVVFQNADPSNALPIGAYVQGTVIGTGGTVSNGLLGTLTMTKTDESGDYQMGVNFEPMGATNCTVLAYLNGRLVGQEVNVPDGLLRKIIGHLLVSIGTGLLQGSLTAGVEADFGSSVSYQMGNGTSVTCDTLFIYPGNVSIADITDLQITASEVPSLSLTSIAVSPIQIHVSQSSGTLLLQWYGSSVLQQSTDLKSWTDVTNAPNSYSVVPAKGGPSKFYRLVFTP